ncbi:MAG: hydroxyisourate hydrolase [Ferruginibacter sp.]
MSQLTTHILDTSKGRPAEDVIIILYHGELDGWTEIARDRTNSDGRIPALLPEGLLLEPGSYKLHFETREYFDRNKVKTFYPYVEIFFEVDSSEHYHVPLLLNPYGYSTYRGS